MLVWINQTFNDKYFQLFSSLKEEITITISTQKEYDCLKMKSKVFEFQFVLAN